MAIAVDGAKNRFYSERNGRDREDIMNNATANHIADKELAEKCNEVRKQYLTGKLTKEEFLRHCDELEVLAKHIAQGKRMTSDSRDKQYASN